MTDASFGDTLVAFVLLLSILIFVHELGHFWAAKACGVRVLKFSIGFGSPIGFGRWRLAWKRGHTEYVVAWFPLGGFVKMLGESPDEEDSPETRASPEETLGAKPLWQKLTIVFAGPVMNLVLPVLLFAGMHAIGMPRAESVVGQVEPGSPAAEVGLRAGDRIVALDGEPVHWWNELYRAVREDDDGQLQLRYERDGREAEVTVPIARRNELDPFGAIGEQGWTGLHHAMPMPLLAVIGAESPARRAGLRSGDLVLAVAGEEVPDWYALRDAYVAAPDGDVALRVQRAQGEEPVELDLAVPALGSLDALGVRPASALLTAVESGSPAERAGLAPGDVIVSYGDEPVTFFDSFAQAVSSSAGERRSLEYLRDGEVHRVAIAAEPLETDFDVAGPRYRVGIAGVNALVSGETSLYRERNPLTALVRGTEETVEMTGLFLVGLGKLVTGDVSRKNLSGPIGIAQMAGDAMVRGWEQYLRLMVLISINLGILNLLPIPILDGGQAAMFLVESARRGPLSLRTKLAMQQFGLTVLVLLMGLAFWNDLSRIFSQLW